MIKRFAALILALVVFVMPVFAESLPDETIPDAVEWSADPAPEPTEAPAEGSAAVTVQLDHDALVAAIRDALATPEPVDDATIPEEQPTPTPQIIVVQLTPETAATPEPSPVPTIWDKSFDAYSPSEGLLLCIFIMGLFVFMIWIFKGGLFRG